MKLTSKFIQKEIDNGDTLVLNNNGIIPSNT